MHTYRIMHQDDEIDRVSAPTERDALELHARRAGWRDGADSYLREHRVRAVAIPRADLEQYEVRAPAIPGAQPTVILAQSYAHALQIAELRFAGRSDLRGQDVMILRGGKRVCYAGPSR